MYKPIKELGQNFLTDPKIVESMVNALEFREGSDLIEIGPGHGVLTRLIVQRIKDRDIVLNAVEIDNRLGAKITQEFSGVKNVKVYREDILGFLPKFECKRPFSIIGSLPYYITSPILHKVIKMKSLPEVCVFLVQKEVAEKIKNIAPDTSYLSSFIQSFYNVIYLGKVDADKFDPVPDVDGGILKFVKRDFSDRVGRKFIERYEGFLHKAYSHPRKMLNKAFLKEELEKGKVGPSLRAQNLNADEWLAFFRILNPKI